LTAHTTQRAEVYINEIMNKFDISWGKIL
jgi:hypothetical protein